MSTERGEHHPLIILGSGPAGCSAAIYASRANLAPLLISGSEPGGQLMTTTDVENWPAGEEGLTGPVLMERMQEHATRFGGRSVMDQVREARLDVRPFVLRGDLGEYSCDALILATGASARYLGLESEQAFLGKGVSACATCDGFFYRDREVLVVGGGNTAAEEALYLCNIASKVHMAHRRDALRAESILRERLARREAEGKLQMHWNCELQQVLGDDSGVTGAVLRENQAGGGERRLELPGVFIAIGHTPNTGIFRGLLDMDEAGYIAVAGGLQGNATQTSVPGVFACGDVADSVYRQAVTSAGTGCMAALDAERHLAALQADV